MSDEVINVITKSIENWRVELAVGERTLGEMKIQRGIFQEDSISPLLFVIPISLNYILKKCTGGYKFTKPQEKINPHKYMNDIKPFAKNEKQLKTLI